MKKWQTVSVLALSVAIAAAGWVFAPRSGSKKVSVGSEFSSRIDQGKGQGDGSRAEKINSSSGVRANRFGFDDPETDKGMSLAFGDGFGFEDEIKEKLSTVIQEIYDQYLSASKRDDGKAMLAAIRRLLAKAATGEKLPAWLKQNMIEGLKWSGDVSSAMPELMALAADPDEAISNAALESLQDLLWDFNTTPQQIASALLQVVRLSSDATVIEPFIFEMNDMPMQLRASTAIAVLDSGNPTAAQCLNDNMQFIFDDFNGSIKTREDILQYAEKHAAEDAVETVTDSSKEKKQ